jgi:hypothetical protein
MGEYRHRVTGEVKTQGEWRSANPQISLPRTWNQIVLDTLNIEAVFESPQPNVGQYQTVVRNSVTQDAKGNWVQAWAVVDMFSDDDESTKAEKESAYQAGLDTDVAKSIRAERNRLLSESDWTQVLDAPVDQDAWATYRQALRDITSQEGFPHSVVWPTKPQ